jgi:Zn finger protein HypA/HybF involved in hydrogenase expression
MIPAKVKECVQCQAEFEISASEMQQLQQRGFDEPRRCPACRRNKSKVAGDREYQKRHDKKKHYRMKYE